MKKIFFILFLISFHFGSSQNEDSDEVGFHVIENVPIYRGCDESMSNRDLKTCMSSKISEHVGKHFKIRIAKKLNLPSGKVKMYAGFKIDKKGNIIDIVARAPHPDLEKEIIRVIKKIPKLDRPGIVRGKPVIVPYSLPIIFAVK